MTVRHDRNRTTPADDVKPLQLRFDVIACADLGRAMGAEAAKSAKRQTVRNRIIVALTLARWTDPQRWLSYTRDNNVLAAQARYFGAGGSRAPFLWAIDSLDGAGLIDHRLTWPSANARYQSTMRANCSFQQRVPLLGLDELIPFASELIILKRDRSRVGYRDTAQTKCWRLDVEQQNSALAGLTISLHAPDWTTDHHGLLRSETQTLNPAQIGLYRVFNDSWDRGGRWYGAFWQNLPSRDRAQLRINGEPVFEYDFSCLHPRLLAAMSGRALDGDPYAACNIPRPDAKRAFNTLINADSERSAIDAMRSEFSKQGRPQPHQLANTVVAAIKNGLPGFSWAWGCGEGVRLQAIDARIATRVQKHMRNAGHPVLSVHDSFIVGDAMRDLVEQVCEAALEREIKNIWRSKKI